MAHKAFLLPDLGEGLTEGEIVQWLVATGDTVEVDQPVAEVETAKAVVEVPSPFAGTVVTLHADVGQEVEVGQPLLTIDLDGGGAAGPAAAATPDDAEAQPTGVLGGSSEDAEAAEMVPQPADEADADSGSVLVGYGTAGGAKARRRGRGPTPAQPRAASPPARPLAKPPVRKLAKDLGVDLAAVHGSGPGGVITREDVRTHSAAGVGEHAGNGRREAATAPRAQPQPGERRIPLRGVRKAIAEKMTLSRREIPEATSWVDADATALWQLRDRLNAAQDRVRVSPLAIVLRAVVAGLREFPEVNARLDTEAGEIVVPGHVNLGVAAQTDRGLVVPVIKDAQGRSLLGLAEELNRLAAAAREGSVRPDELTGGTFTVSNYGSFGVDGGSPVINHPEAAILGVGRIVDRPWVVDGAVQVRKVVQLSVAFDHRICDGGDAAGFLRFVADCVESTDTMLSVL